MNFRTILNRTPFLGKRHRRPRVEWGVGDGIRLLLFLGLLLLLRFVHAAPHQDEK